MKTYEVMGRTFETRPVSLAAEDQFRQIAFTEEGEYSEESVNNLAKDSEKLNALMAVLLKGDHDGIDWRLDADSDVVGEVLGDFFTKFADKMRRRVDTLSKQSSPEK